MSDQVERMARAEVDAWAAQYLAHHDRHAYEDLDDTASRLAFRSGYRRGNAAGRQLGRGEGAIDAFGEGWDVCFGLTAGGRVTPQVLTMLDLLTPHQRRVVAMVCLLNKSYGTAADWLGIGSEGVRRHMQAAAKALGLSGVGELRKRMADASVCPTNACSESGSVSDSEPGASGIDTRRLRGV